MAQDALRTSILSTLALAEAEICPALSSETIAAYLHHAANPLAEDDASLARACTDLVRERLIRAEHGHYALTSHASAFQILRERSAVQKKKIERNNIPLLLMQAIPFLESAAITGSVAMNAARPHSDVDVFCVTSKKRLWTVRALVLFLAAIFFRRRDRSITGEKLCFNYFLAENTRAPIQNIASAHMFARALPLFASDALDRFFSANAWITDFLRLPEKESLFPSIRALRMIARALSSLLSGPQGDRIETALKRWQMHRLEQKAMRGGDTSHFILRDDALLLHYPDIKNKEVMESYRQRMQMLGIAPRD